MELSVYALKRVPQVVWVLFVHIYFAYLLAASYDIGLFAITY